MTSPAELSGQAPEPAPLRIGLVGYGFGGRRFHAPLIASAAQCTFAGVVTTSPERRALVEQDVPGTPVLDSLEALAAAGAEAVAISTPLATHVPLMEQALRLGLAVVCDKPFGPDAAAVTAVVELAESLGLPLSPYQNRRWDSDFRTVRRLLDDGRLGALHRFESRFERFRPDSGPGEAGGGSLLDFGSHLVDQALVLCGPVTRVYAESHAPQGGLDDDVFVALTHEGGVRSHLWGSWVQGAPGPRFRVTGTTGTYVVADVDGQEQALVDGASPASLGAEWGVEPEAAWGTLSRGGPAEPVPSERGAWDTFYPAFAAAVRGEGALPVQARDAVETARVLDAARASAEQGRVVDLD